MQPDDRSAFAALLAQLGTNFQREVTSAVVTLYWAGLKDLPIADLRAAVERHILASTDRFDFPTIGKLRALANPTAPISEDAGRIFDALCDRHPSLKLRHSDPSYWLGPEVEVTFGPVARAAFYAAGGTGAFMHRTDRDTPFIRRDFVAGYREAAEAHRQGLLPAGEAPSRGIRGGDPTPITALIGVPKTGKEAA